MPTDQYHEPPDELSAEARTYARMVTSLQEETEAIGWYAQRISLEPGDVVSTGTPAGVGGQRDPQVWLKPGDEVVVSSPQLGVLETRLA